MILPRPAIEAGVPGLRRRIELYPSANVIDVALEDDFHRFILRLEHDDGIVTAVDSRAERYPWSTCPQAGPFLASQAIGKALDDVARQDPHDHCTHMFELVVLCAAHANDSAPIRFDLFVADRTGESARGSLFENGVETLRWFVAGTRIEGPDPWTGRDLRGLSAWRRELTSGDAERAMLLRRAFHISGGRQPNLALPKRAVDRGANRIGACYTYQMPRATEAFASGEWRRDHSDCSERLLEGYRPEG